MQRHLERGQESAGRLADALEVIISGQAKEDAVFETFGLADVLTLESWRLMVQTRATEPGVNALRRFAGQDTSETKRQTVESMRHIYVARKIERAICSIPKNAQLIEKAIALKVGLQPKLDDKMYQSVANFECQLLANKPLFTELRENVEIRDPVYADYENHVTLINHGVLRISK